MTVALTIHQPYASLLAHGIKKWETRPHPPAGWPGIPEGTRRMPGCRVEPGETVLIHAAAKRPTIKTLDRFTDITGEPRAQGAHAWLDCAYHAVIPTPLSAVVATARILDVVPIAECDWHSNHICLPWSGELTHHSPMDEPHDNQTEHDISNQLPYGEWTPGRWAWRLGDVRLLDEPVREYPVPVDDAGCSISYCFGATGAEMEQYPICKGCNYDGTSMVPVRGRQGVWRPDPALVAACGIIPGEATT